VEVEDDVVHLGRLVEGEREGDVEDGVLEASGESTLRL
jgi:hypothetical protein